MSKFFHKDSDESSDDDQEEGFEEGEGGATVGTAARFGQLESSSESEDEEKRVVRSAKQKRSDEFADVVRALNNHKKIRDFSSVFSDFEELIRVYEKGKKIDLGTSYFILLKFCFLSFLSIFYL